ncbi:MAG TPA: M13 family metallopeptidase [Pyrinomonadaceae bacterium]|nr:M13 family metallopeptidase [Pyrinomonadaceae bacterium]
MRYLTLRVVLSLCAFTLGVALLTGLPARAALTQQSSTRTQSRRADTGSSTTTVHGFDVSGMDRSVGACQDFNQFANGGWMARNPVPPAYSRWGRFQLLIDQNTEVLHQILESLVARRNLKPGTNEQKIADYYASCMDEAGIEREGINPLRPEFERINQIHDAASLESEVAVFHSHRIPTLFGFGAGQDFKNSRQVIAQAGQGGLGLPDRDYYTKQDERFKRTREEYVKHVARMFELAGDAGTRAQEEAETVMRIETKLAEASATREQLREPAANYHKMTVAQLNELTPHFNWTHYMTELGLTGINDLNVAHPEFLKAVDKLLTETPLDDIKTYMRWHLINSAASTLSSAFVREDFNFGGHFLNGTQEILPRWKRCVASTDRSLGEALGELYVKKTFTPQARQRAQQMVMNLVAALREDLSTLDWMSQQTRQRATAKLDAFIRKIGYPDRWRDYEALRVTRGAYYNNLVLARSFDVRRNLTKIGKPVDRTEWGMTPPTVNAYYNPTINEIVFPAGILQPPFFDPQADDAINYGGIGAVIGHEMTHGFDDQGAQFDADGNLQNWWTPDDFKKFRERTDCVVKQFDDYEVEPGIHQIGKRVVGESVADLGGLTIAFKAFLKSMQGKPRPRDIDGFTPEQRFFLGYAQIWAQTIRPEAARQQVQNDPHPLGRFRVNGPLSNMTQFAQAYGCNMGDAMVRPPERRCQIW